MIIQCQHCGTKFKLDAPEELKAFKVKCSVCATIFTVDSERGDHIPKIIPVPDSTPSFNLVEEKQELDLFLSEILKSRPSENESAASIPERIQTLPQDQEQAAPKPDKEIIFSGADRYNKKDEITPIREDLDIPLTHADPAVEAEIGAQPDYTMSRPFPKVTDISLTEADTRNESLPDLSREMLGIKGKQERAPKQAKRPGPSGIRKHLVGLSILFILATVAVLLWIYPQAGDGVLGWASANIPMMDQVLEVKKEKKADPLEKIQITGLKQRFVVNSQIGKIRVIEGFVSNQADIPVTKIRLMARLYDARSTLLAAKIVNCGSVLNDDGLENLGEQEMAAALNKLKEGPAADRIEPKKSIPFMIVFPNEPQGVTQAFVVPLTAERAM